MPAVTAMSRSSPALARVLLLLAALVAGVCGHGHFHTYKKNHDRIQVNATQGCGNDSVLTVSGQHSWWVGMPLMYYIPFLRYARSAHRYDSSEEEDQPRRRVVITRGRCNNNPPITTPAVNQRPYYNNRQPTVRSFTQRTTPGVTAKGSRQTKQTEETTAFNNPLTVVDGSDFETTSNFKLETIKTTTVEAMKTTIIAATQFKETSTFKTAEITTEGNIFRNKETTPGDQTSRSNDATTVMSTTITPTLFTVTSVSLTAETTRESRESTNKGTGSSRYETPPNTEIPTVMPGSLITEFAHTATTNVEISSKMVPSLTTDGATTMEILTTRSFNPEGTTTKEEKATALILEMQTKSETTESIKAREESTTKKNEVTTSLISTSIIQPETTTTSQVTVSDITKTTMISAATSSSEATHSTEHEVSKSEVTISEEGGHTSEHEASSMKSADYDSVTISTEASNESADIKMAKKKERDQKMIWELKPDDKLPSKFNVTDSKLNKIQNEINKMNGSDTTIINNGALNGSTITVNNTIVYTSNISMTNISNTQTINGSPTINTTVITFNSSMTNFSNAQTINGSFNNNINTNNATSIYNTTIYTYNNSMTNYSSTQNLSGSSKIESIFNPNATLLNNNNISNISQQNTNDSNVSGASTTKITGSNNTWNTSTDSTFKWNKTENIGNNNFNSNVNISISDFANKSNTVDPTTVSGVPTNNSGTTDSLSKWNKTENVVYNNASSNINVSVPDVVNNNKPTTVKETVPASNGSTLQPRGKIGCSDLVMKNFSAIMFTKEVRKGCLQRYKNMPGAGKYNSFGGSSEEKFISLNDKDLHTKYSQCILNCYFTGHNLVISSSGLINVPALNGLMAANLVEPLKVVAVDAIKNCSQMISAGIIGKQVMKKGFKKQSGDCEKQPLVMWRCVKKFIAKYCNLCKQHDSKKKEGGGGVKMGINTVMVVQLGEMVPLFRPRNRDRNYRDDDRNNYNHGGGDKDSWGNDKNSHGDDKNKHGDDDKNSRGDDKNNRSDDKNSRGNDKKSHGNDKNRRGDDKNVRGDDKNYSRGDDKNNRSDDKNSRSDDKSSRGDDKSSKQ